MFIIAAKRRIIGKAIDFYNSLSDSTGKEIEERTTVFQFSRCWLQNEKGDIP